MVWQFNPLYLHNNVLTDLLVLSVLKNLTSLTRISNHVPADTKYAANSAVLLKTLLTAF
jgi:hypothetical protein